MILDAETLICDFCDRMALAVEEEGGCFESAHSRFYRVIQFAHAEELLAIQRRNREQDFITFGEAAAENKAEVNRNWYLEIMQNSEFKDE